MAETNRWARFSDKELQLITDRLAAGLLAQDSSQKAKDRARIIDEIKEVQGRREDEQSTYRGPGRYRHVSGKVYEVLGTADGQEGDQQIVIMHYPPGSYSYETKREFEFLDNCGRRRYEYLGPLEDATAPAEIMLLDSGYGWALLETWDGNHHRLNTGDILTALVPEAEKPAVHYYERADGRLICHSSAKPCGRVYRDHPTETYGDLVLHRLCDGRLVKL